MLPVWMDQYWRRTPKISMSSWARQQRPNLKWVVHAITKATFYVNKLKHHPIGCGVNLPNYILNNKVVVALQKDKSNNYTYTDNLCLFRCLVVWSECHFHNFRATVVAYFRHIAGTEANPKQFPGVTLSELPNIEERFEVNANV